MINNVFAFDIETVPDVDAGRRLYGLKNLDDGEVAEVMHTRSRQATGYEFLRHHQQRVVAVSVALRSGERFKVWSLGTPESPEPELVQRFFDGVERYSPTLVSWNGGGFDLPVLHYRALVHGVVSARYWEIGDEETSFRWNNYLGRFHWRHTDLMDVLSGYQIRAAAPLHEVASLLGLPGKLGMDGAAVLPRWLAGDLTAIRDYCEVDVLNTYLIYLRFELMRGRLTPEAHARECQIVRDALTEENKPHLAQFLAAWKP